MLERFVHFQISKAQRTAVSRAVVQDTRGAAPFRHQQVVFDTAAGTCSERGLYLLADSVPDLHGDRIHRAIQPLTACAAFEHAWPDTQRQFDLQTLTQLLNEPNTGLGPPLELSSPLLPRARLVCRGRRGLVRTSEGQQTVIEVVFQRCELATARKRLVEYRLSLHLLSGDMKELFALAWRWQRRFKLVPEAMPVCILAARMASGLAPRAHQFSAPVWLPGRSLPEVASYPTVSGPALLRATASDLALQVGSVGQSEAAHETPDGQAARLTAFEQSVQAADCLLHFVSEYSDSSLPIELTEPLLFLQDRRYEHLVQSRFTHWTKEAGAESVAADASVRLALGVDGGDGLQTLMSEPKTHQWVSTLLAWCESRYPDSAFTLANPSLVTSDVDERDADRQHLEQWVQQVKVSIEQAQQAEFNARFPFWRTLHKLDEALTQFGAVLPRRLLLRFRMNIRATLVPLTDWLILTRLLERLLSLDPHDQRIVKRTTWPQDHQTLATAWQTQLALANQRVNSQLARLAQAVTPDDSLSMPTR
ncbi:MAG: hypothetical protein AB8C46_01590 [Burkholderiaceae bacterium]